MGRTCHRKHNNCFNVFVTALREELQLPIEKKSRISGNVSSAFYQLYGRVPKKRSDRNDGENPVGWDGRRTLCKVCGGADHIKRDCPDKSPTDYAQGQLQNGTPAIHVLHELSLRMDNLQFDSDVGEESGETREIGFENEQGSDLATFNALDDNEDSSLVMETIMEICISLKRSIAPAQLITSCRS